MTRINIPIFQTLKSYNGTKAKHDIYAAVNVALLDFPQGMAYAMIAGLPYFVGIFGSIIASIIGPVFASSRFIMLGPSNAIAVMCLAVFLGLGFSQAETLAAMPTLLFMVSVIMIVGSSLKLANLVNFVSSTVISGYISAAAMLIIVKQLKYVLGVEVPSSPTFAITFYQTIQHVRAVNLHELCAGILTLFVYFLLTKTVPKLPAVAISLVFMFFVSKVALTESIHFATLSSGAMSMPESLFIIPSFSLELITKLVPGALAISFLSLLESSSISKTLAAQAGDAIDSNQQMFSIGVASLGSSIFGGMPISGSLTRSMLNFKSGAMTPMASIFSGIILALMFYLLAKYVGQIPKSSLAALVIVVGISLFNRKNIRYALGTTPEDRIVYLVTFIGGLFFSLNTAIFVGVVTSMLLFIKKASNPELVEYKLSNQGFQGGAIESGSEEVALLHVEGDLFFASSDMFLNQARNLAHNPHLKAIILRMRNAHNLDATCAMALEQFVNYARSKHCHVIVAGAHREVVEILEKSGLVSVIGEDNVIEEDPDNPTLSTSLALKRSIALVGEKVDLKLFVSESHIS